MTLPDIWSIQYTSCGAAQLFTEHVRCQSPASLFALYKREDVLREYAAAYRQIGESPVPLFLSNVEFTEKRNAITCCCKTFHRFDRIGQKCCFGSETGFCKSIGYDAVNKHRTVGENQRIGLAKASVTDSSPPEDDLAKQRHPDGFLFAIMFLLAARLAD